MKLSDLSNSLVTWAVEVGIVLLIFTVLMILRKIALKKLKIIALVKSTLINDLFSEILAATKVYFLASLSIYMGSHLFSLSYEIRNYLYRAFILIFLVQISFWGNGVTTFWINDYLKKRSDPRTTTSLGLISLSIKSALFLFLLLFGIHSCGFDITTLIAGLGVGGIAVALAVQKILADLFASLSIVLDNPFDVGDLIEVGEFTGTIEQIGLKTTRIRSISGEQLIFPNADLLSSRIRNYKRMSERRILFTLEIAYQNDSKLLKIIPTIIEEIISGLEQARFERCHFLKFGSSYLEFQCVYWVESPNFQNYANIAQMINIEIFQRFQTQGIDFAHPTQAVFVQNIPIGT